MPAGIRPGKVDVSISDHDQTVQTLSLVSGSAHRTAYRLSLKIRLASAVTSGISTPQAPSSKVPAPAMLQLLKIRLRCRSGGGAVGLLTAAMFKSADLSNLTPSNLKLGVTVAGVTGIYPSSEAPLGGGSVDATDLTAGGLNAAIAANNDFEWWAADGAHHVAHGDADLADPANVETALPS